MSQLIPNLKYKELYNVDSDFFHDIKTIFIFSDNDVTKSNDVYAYGSNANGRLGLGTRSHVIKPTIIPELSRKGVTNILCGQFFMIAFTETMDIYAWGYSDFDIYSRPRKVLGVSDKKEIYVRYCCGSTGAYVLADTNILYHVDCSIKQEHCILSPICPSLCNRVIDISCGDGHLLALMDSGKAFACGIITVGQLGVGNTNDKSVHDRALIPNFKNIKAISCGSSHSLLLTSDDKIYSVGGNINGQLGNGHKRSQVHYQLVKASGKFVEIFAFRNVSMALNDKNYVAIWGDHQDRSNYFFSNCR